MEKTAEQNLRNMIQEQMKSLLTENSLSGLPKLWVKDLVNKGCGENSKIEDAGNPISPNTYKIFNKNKNAEAIILKQNGKPIYMITVYSERKFRMFKPDQNSTNYAHRSSYGRRGGYAEETFTAQEIASKIENEFTEKPAVKGFGAPPTLSQQTGADKKGLASIKAEVIYKDEARSSLSKQRYAANTETDPLSKNYSRRAKDQDQYAGWNTRISPEQRKIATKFQSIVQPKVVAKLDAELEAIKQKIATAIDTQLLKVKEDILKGYSFYADKKHVGDTLMSGVKNEDFINLKRYAEALSILKDANLKPEDIATKFKKLGLKFPKTGETLTPIQ